MIRTGQEGSGLVRNDKNMPELVRNVQGWSEMIRTGQESSGLVWHDQDWSGMIKTGQD